MSLMISAQTEARLTKEARRRGITVYTLLQRLVDERDAGVAEPHREPRPLPVWRLGSASSFHRRDIYDGAR